MPNGDWNVSDLIRSLNSAPRAEQTTMVELRAGMERFASLFPANGTCQTSTETLGGVPGERFNAGAGPRVLYLHGGGYCIGSSRSHRHVTARLAQELSGEVFSLDYRLAPEAPFPAAHEDAVAAWNAFSGEAGSPVAIAGDSAGGGLACALTAVLLGNGAPPPASLTLFSPWVSLKSTADSFDRLAQLDPLVSRNTADFFARHYAAEHQQDGAFASPLGCDVSRFPPTLIQAGGREVFLDDIEAFAARLQAHDRSVTLTVRPDMFHVWHLYWPWLAEGRAALAEAAQFIRREHDAATDRQEPGCA